MAYRPDAEYAQQMRIKADEAGQIVATKVSDLVNMLSIVDLTKLDGAYATERFIIIVLEEVKQLQIAIKQADKAEEIAYH